MVDVKMPLTAHLEELRWRLIKALAAIGVAFAASYNFAEALFAWLTEPRLQLNVATGFPSNPQDFVAVSATQAYVTRYEPNPAPGAVPFDGGSGGYQLGPSCLNILYHPGDVQGKRFNPGVIRNSRDRIGINFQHRRSGAIAQKMDIMRLI